MSANIYYKPTAFTGTDVTPGAPSMFIETLEKTFDRSLPLSLDRAACQILRGMMYTTTDPLFKKSFEDLIEGIEKYDEIEVYAVY